MTEVVGGSAASSAHYDTRSAKVRPAAHEHFPHSPAKSFELQTGFTSELESFAKDHAVHEAALLFCCLALEEELVDLSWGEEVVLQPQLLSPASEGFAGDAWLHLRCGQIASPMSL